MVGDAADGEEDEVADDDGDDDDGGDPRPRGMEPVVEVYHRKGWRQQWYLHNLEGKIKSKISN